MCAAPVHSLTPDLFVCLTVPTHLNTQKYGLFCSQGGKGRGGERTSRGLFFERSRFFILISLQYKYSDDILITVEASSLSEIIIFFLK